MKKGMSLIEIIIGLFLLAVVIAILMPAINRRSHTASPRASCQNNLKQMGLVFKMYANESKDQRFPPIMGTTVDLLDCDDPKHPSKEKGGLLLAAPSLVSIFPEYLTDQNVLTCPSGPNYLGNKFINPKLGENETMLPCAQPDRGMRLAAHDYFYLGWAFDLSTCEDEMLQVGSLVGPRQMTESLALIAESWKRKVATADNVAALDEDIHTITNGFGTKHEGTTIYRLREGIERFLITDYQNPAASAKAESETWIMADRPTPASDGKAVDFAPDYAHIPGGANVLYMDGHVAFQKYAKNIRTKQGSKKSNDDSPCPGPTNEGVARLLTTGF